MVRVTIELVPHGNEEYKRTIGVMEIANDGTGDAKAGNYTYTLSHAGMYFGRKGHFKQGRVKGFLRRLSPYRLVQRCLKDAGEV